MTNGSSHPRRCRAFSLVELMLVVTVIVILIALLMPAFRMSRERVRRATCATNLAGIAQGMIHYGASNQGRLIVCRGRSVQKAFNPQGVGVHNNRHWDDDIDWIDALASVGLVDREKTNQGGGYMERSPSPLWNCPSRNYKSQWEPGYPQLVVGYQYFGGIDKWINPFFGTKPARAPLSLRSNGRWALGADSAMKIDHVWGGGRASAYGGLPAHKAGDQAHPAGGNQLYLDGSVAWVDFENLIYIHSWNNNYARIAYFYQEDLGGWTPPPQAYGQP
jgi:prepilin-type processing-associated H-X9-DG protein